MELSRRHLLGAWAFLVTVTATGCGSAGGGASGPCATDCSLVDTQDPCLVSVCNEGQHPGSVGQCVVVSAPDGSACDDGLFCTGQNGAGATGGDACLSGVCAAGAPNRCGRPLSTCEAVACDEQLQACSVTAANEGATCDELPTCQVGGVCAGGLCVGSPVDCSPLDAGCRKGVCNAVSGLCETEPPGGVCSGGLGVCQVGTCLADGTCSVSNLPPGTPCSDRNACTTNDACDDTGSCSGTALPGCTTYFEEAFEGCPPGGWTLGAGWECGVPTSGPGAAFSGNGVVATGLDGPYANNLSYFVSNARTPPINLSGATAPVLSLWAWWNTENPYDGWHVEISTDGGATFSTLSSVTPIYDAVVAAQMAWSGDQSSAGWQMVIGDLQPYIDQTVVLRFAFHSDGSISRPGAYLDEVRVGEASAVPLAIATPGPLPLALATVPYAVALSRQGGSSAATWSIVGGTNHAWLGIDPVTGELAGTPLAGNVGAAAVTVQIEEPVDPTNFDERTYDLEVLGPPIWSEGFEAACPGGWTLAGDWQCGSPTSGPGSAYAGIQCLATRLDGSYSPNQAWATTTATSPTIDLTAATAPRLLWRAWLRTEGGVFDGTNLKVSTDGGASWQIVTAVTPPYPLTIDGEPAWGGDQSSLGWQTFEADLSAYAGQQIQVRFAFRSDASVVYPGVYIDELVVTD